MKMRIKLLDPDLPQPTRATADDAGLDLRARVSCVIEPGERKRIPCGVAVELPPGHAGLVMPRSGLAESKGLSFANACGLIDPGYRGEIQVIAVNLDRQRPIEVHKGERIAQLVVVPVAYPEIERVEELSLTQRGESGFGSTGLS
ncbi:MAG: dUTP diphosphatase [Acidimicrobiia bacterium]